MTDLRYPIGKFERPPVVDTDAAIAEIERCPSELRALVGRMTPEQLATPYREGGWTVRQVVHHLVDSHIHSYVRFKLAMTENEPTIKPYKEAAWAELEDARNGPVEVSLTMLDALHARWAAFMRSLKPEDWQRKFVHPERGAVSLDVTAALYAWHGRHHLAHVKLIAH